MDEANKKFWLEQRRKGFEASLESSFERAERVPVLNVIPGEYFSRASYECRELFISGHFVACISLCQSVAEGLSKFVTATKKIRYSKDYKARCSKLFKEKLISKDALVAFQTIHGNDRDEFHHMNDTVIENYSLLEKRAESCLKDLFRIESEIFNHHFDEGTLVPKNPEYWSIDLESGTANISLRQYF